MRRSQLHHNIPERWGPCVATEFYHGFLYATPKRVLDNLPYYVLVVETMQPYTNDRTYKMLVDFISNNREPVLSRDLKDVSEMLFGEHAAAWIRGVVYKYGACFVVYSGSGIAFLLRRVYFRCCCLSIRFSLAKTVWLNAIVTISHLRLWRSTCHDFVGSRS